MNRTSCITALGITLFLAAPACSSSSSSPSDAATGGDSSKPADAGPRSDGPSPLDAVAKHDAPASPDAAPKSDAVARADAPTAVDGGDLYNCPATVPSGACSTTANPHTCWYGSDSRFFCRTQAVCKGSTWTVTEPLAGCTSADQPADCPAGDASWPQAFCNNADGGFSGTCVYGGAACYCGFTGGPDQGLQCESVPAGCPALPPDPGDPCTSSSSSASCVYQPCQQAAQCTNGKWVWSPLAC